MESMYSGVKPTEERVRYQLRPVKMRESFRPWPTFLGGFLLPFTSFAGLPDSSLPGFVDAAPEDFMKSDWHAIGDDIAWSAHTIVREVDPNGQLATATGK